MAFPALPYKMEAVSTPLGHIKESQVGATRPLAIHQMALVVEHDFAGAKSTSVEKKYVGSARATLTEKYHLALELVFCHLRCQKMLHQWLLCRRSDAAG